MMKILNIFLFSFFLLCSNNILSQKIEFEYGDNKFMNEEKYYDIHKNDTVRWFSLRDSLPDGKYFCFVKNDSLLKLYYKFTVSQFTFVDTFSKYFDSSFAVEYQNVFKSGKIIKTIGYYSNGNIRILSRKMFGHYYGDYCSFDSLGSLNVKGKYNHEGERIDNWVYYYKGKIERCGKYRNGKEHGKWYYYNFIDGSLSKIEFYQNGFLYKIKFFR